MVKQVILERDGIAKLSYVYGVSNCSLFYLWSWKFYFKNRD